ncbi:MAG: hypothetical protein N2491_13025 [Negativicutes bacterium]|nr:hypothetical protein [Negativicutes bacterium]
MTLAETFVTALRRWHAETNPQTIAYPDLLVTLAQDLGCRWEDGQELLAATPEDYLRAIDERLFYLHNDLGLAESLLVTGLVHHVAAYLKKSVSERSQTIAFLKNALKDADEIETILLKLQQLNDPGYLAQAEYELANWRRITAAIVDTM